MIGPTASHNSPGGPDSRAFLTTTCQQIINTSPINRPLDDFQLHAFKTLENEYLHGVITVAIY